MKLGGRVNPSILFALLLLALFIGQSTASLGDHLPDFRECVQVSWFYHVSMSAYSIPLTNIGL